VNIDTRTPQRIVAGVGTLFLTIGLVVSWNTVSFLKRSESTVARISGVDAVADPRAVGPAPPLYYPRLEFTDAAGRSHEVRGDVSRQESNGGGTSFTHSGWTMGEAVTIRYERANPEHIRMGGTWTWLLPAAFVILGAGAILIAARIAREAREGNTHVALSSSAAVVLLAAGVAATAATPAAAAGPATSLSFNGVAFQHRWSQGGQNEYTPPGEEDLGAWKSMVTINLHDWARNGDQLAELANRVLGNYQASGRVLRTDSKPRTKDHEAEHFAAVLLGGPNPIEIAFARILLVDGRGVVIVYSRRFSGATVDNDVRTWLAANGESTEKALRSWTGLPSLAAIAALPQAKPVSGAR